MWLIHFARREVIRGMAPSCVRAFGWRATTDPGAPSHRPSLRRGVIYFGVNPCRYPKVPFFTALPVASVATVNRHCGAADGLHESSVRSAGTTSSISRTRSLRLALIWSIGLATRFAESLLITMANLKGPIVPAPLRDRPYVRPILARSQADPGFRPRRVTWRRSSLTMSTAPAVARPPVPMQGAKGT